MDREVVGEVDSLPAESDRFPVPVHRPSLLGQTVLVNDHRWHRLYQPVAEAFDKTRLLPVAVAERALFPARVAGEMASIPVNAQDENPTASPDPAVPRSW